MGMMSQWPWPHTLLEPLHRSAPTRRRAIGRITGRCALLAVRNDRRHGRRTVERSILLSLLDVYATVEQDGRVHDIRRRARCTSDVVRAQGDGDGTPFVQSSSSGLHSGGFRQPHTHSPAGQSPPQLHSALTAAGPARPRPCPWTAPPPRTTCSGAGTNGMRASKGSAGSAGGSPEGLEWPVHARPTDRPGPRPSVAGAHNMGIS